MNDLAITTLYIRLRNFCAVLCALWIVTTASGLGVYVKLEIVVSTGTVKYGYNNGS
jgi:hypothetical protein